MATISNVFCTSCGTRFEIELARWSCATSFCSSTCHRSFSAKHRTALKDYTLTKPTGDLRLSVAELDHIPELDPILEKLASMPDILIDRYRVPGYIFRGHPPGVGLDFPIATLECEGERTWRKFGVKAVIKALSKLTPTSAPTRKMKRPVFARKGGLLIPSKNLD